MTPPNFKEPAALDLLSDFVKRYGKIIYDADEESNRRDATVYFEPELHRMIQAFVNEAVQPLQKVLLDAAMVRAHPMMVIDRDTVEQRTIETELWRGQHRGYWYRLVLRDRLEFQVNTGMDTSPEHECWSVVWGA